MADGIVWQDCDVRMELVWRRAGGTDATVVSFEHRFEAWPDNPDGTGNFDAVPFEDSAAAALVPAQAGDELVWRFTVLTGSGPGPQYAPNGDGTSSRGRIPYVDIPAE